MSDADRWNLLQARRQEIATYETVATFREAGLDPIVIKGVAAARYHPKGQYRLSVDVDLAVEPAQFKRALDVAKVSGNPSVPVDVHAGLRHLDTLPWEDLLASAVDLQLPEGSVKVLRPEDDLRVLVVHWLTDGGVYKHRLWDIYHLIAGRSSDFDWDRCLSVVSHRRQRWIACTVGAAAKYLDLDLSGTPLEGADQRLPKWFIRTLERAWSWEAGPVPLGLALHDRKLFVSEFMRRLRPDPIYSTIDCEGDLDAITHIHYETRNILRRVGPACRRVTAMYRLRRGMRGPQ